MVYAVCAIEAGETSLLAGRIPVLLAACHRPTTATGLTRRYQWRLRLRRPGGLAAVPTAASLLGAAAGSAAGWRPPPPFRKLSPVRTLGSASLATVLLGSGVAHAEGLSAAETARLMRGEAVSR